jgi:hypothetical protein
MLYFSYAHDLNYRSLVEWHDLRGLCAPLPKPMKSVIATNFRLAFPVFSGYWQGGAAGLIAEPGKRVPGGLVEVTREHLDMLGEFNERTNDPLTGRERGAFRLTDIAVTPYGGGKPIRAATFVPAAPEQGHVPPTRLYIDRLVEAALELDLSVMWVMHLRSVITGPEETSQFFPGRAIAAASSAREDETMTTPASRRAAAQRSRLNLVPALPPRESAVARVS